MVCQMASPHYNSALYWWLTDLVKIHILRKFEWQKEREREREPRNNGGNGMKKTLTWDHVCPETRAAGCPRSTMAVTHLTHWEVVSLALSLLFNAFYWPYIFYWPRIFYKKNIAWGKQNMSLTQNHETNKLRQLLNEKLGLGMPIWQCLCFVHL